MDLNAVSRVDRHAEQRKQSLELQEQLQNTNLKGLQFCELFSSLCFFFHVSINPASSNQHVLICANPDSRIQVTRLRIQMAVTVLEAFTYWFLVEKQVAALIQPSCLWILEDFRGNICGTAPHSHRWRKKGYSKWISCISSRINDSWRNSQQIRTRFCLLCIITWNKRLKIRTSVFNFFFHEI